MIINEISNPPKLPDYPDIQYIERYENESWKFENKKLSIQLKYDGSNIRVAVINGKLLISTRKRLIASPNIRQGFLNAIQANSIQLSKLIRFLSANNIVVFMELFGSKNTPSGYHRNHEKKWDFIIFDIYDLEQKRYIYINNWKFLQEASCFAKFFVQSKNYVSTSYNKLIEYLKQNYMNTGFEGVVIKDYDSQFFTKWKPELYEYPPDQIPNSEINGVLAKAFEVLGDNFFASKTAMPTIARMVRQEAKKHGFKYPSSDRVYRLYLQYRNMLLR